MEECVADFEKHTEQGTKDGLHKLGESIQVISAMMKVCPKVKGDFEKLEYMASVFSSPQTFAWHVAKDLFVNGVNIYKEVTDSVTQWKSKNYEDFGKDVGKALAQLLVGSNGLPLKEDLPDGHAPEDQIAIADDESLPIVVIDPDTNTVTNLFLY